MVTPELFRRFPTPQAMAQGNPAATRSPDPHDRILSQQSQIDSRRGAQRSSPTSTAKVPQTLAELITIPGAARKTANVVLGVAFGKAEGVVVDTHVLRIARRLGLAKAETPEKVERELMRILPEGRWIDFSHQIIQHGRQVCVARKPKCEQCNLEQLCTAKDKSWQS